MRATRFATGAALFGFCFLAFTQEPRTHRLGAALPPGVALVSAASPFDESCNAEQTGTNSHNGAVEPFVTVDPSNPNHLIGVWQQDRWADGGSSGLMTGVSIDRGATWTATYAQFSNCSGLPAYNRASDPWVTISPGGAAFQISLSLANSNNTSAILVSRSSDGGFTWGAPVTLINDALPAAFNDKEMIVADPNDPNYIYAVWDRTAGSVRPAYFARSTDGGATWEAAQSIYDPGVNNGVVTYDQIVVLPGGAVLNLFLLVHSKFTDIDVIRSTDHGATWSQPVFVALDETIGTVNPKTQAALRTGAGLPNAAVDPTSGTIYVVWSDARFSNFQRDGAALSESTDGGMTWSQPEQVNQAPSFQAFTPAVAAGPGGVAVTYFDFRKDTPDPNTLLASAWRVVSMDGGNTWRESPVYGPFNMNSAPPTTEGYFLGDYQGLVAAGSDFLAFFAANLGNVPGTSAILATSSARAGDTSGNGRIELNLHPHAYRPDEPPKPLRRQ